MNVKVPTLGQFESHALRKPFMPYAVELELSCKGFPLDVVGDHKKILGV